MGPRTHCSQGASLLLVAAAMMALGPTVGAHNPLFVDPEVQVGVTETNLRAAAPNETLHVGFRIEYRVPTGGVLVDPVEVAILPTRAPAFLEVVPDPASYEIQPDPGTSDYQILGNLTVKPRELVPASVPYRFLLFVNVTDSGNVEGGYGSAPLYFSMGPRPALELAPGRVAARIDDPLGSQPMTLRNLGNTELRVEFSIDGAVPAGVDLALPAPVNLTGPGGAASPVRLYANHTGTTRLPAASAVPALVTLQATGVSTAGGATKRVLATATVELAWPESASAQSKGGASPAWQAVGTLGVALAALWIMGRPRRR